MNIFEIIQIIQNNTEDYVLLLLILIKLIDRFKLIIIIIFFNYSK